MDRPNLRDRMVIIVVVLAFLGGVILMCKSNVNKAEENYDGKLPFQV